MGDDPKNSSTKTLKFSTDGDGFITQLTQTKTAKRVTRRSSQLQASQIPPQEILNRLELISDFESELEDNALDAEITDPAAKITLVQNPTIMKRQRKDFAIQASNSDDKKKIVEKLKSIQQQHFTFTEAYERHLLFALFGQYEIDTKELLEELKLAKIPTVKVIKANKSTDNTIFFMSFTIDSITLTELQHKFSIINCLHVKWEKHRPRARRPTQCHCCQRFGHAAVNCSLPFRYIKC